MLSLTKSLIEAIKFEDKLLCHKSQTQLRQVTHTLKSYKIFNKKGIFAIDDFIDDTFVRADKKLHKAQGEFHQLPRNGK